MRVVVVLFTVGTAAVGPTSLRGQGAEAAVFLARVTSAGEGIDRDCLEPGYRTTLGGRLSVGTLTRVTRVALTVRTPTFRQASTCVDGFPPPDGTYVVDERTNLLAGRYFGTDVRLEAAERHDVGLAFLAVGAGNSWRSGLDVPYVLVAGGITVTPASRLRVGVEGEYQRLRVRADRVRRTYQNFSLVQVDFLGRVHEWTHLLAFSVVVGIAL